jgi:hypothetical protein
MSVFFIATSVLIDRLPGYEGRGFRFVLAGSPLLPLALFRLEPWVVLLTVAAMSLYLGGRRIAGGTTNVAATLAKGWPIVLAVIPWNKRDRGLALGVAMSSVVMLAFIAVQEGFRSGRAFDGIHTETLVGGVVLLVRHLTGSTLGFISVAGARYIDVPGFSLLVNAIAGLAIAVVGLWFAMRRPQQTMLESLGLMVLGILLASPLSSTQFIWWLAPFVAFSSVRVRRWYLAASVVALASVTVFVPASTLWAVEVVARNALLLGLGVVWITDTARTRQAKQPGLGEHLA